MNGLLLALGAVWLIATGWAALRRPAEAECALWADRHLGGASAYSTLLETRSGPLAQTPDAVRWLERWATANVPQAERTLAARRDPARLVRPLVVVAITASLSVLLLTLPGVAPSGGLESPTTDASAPADRRGPEAVPLAATGVADELASALQSAEPREAAQRDRVKQTGAAAPGQGDSTLGTVVAERHEAPLPPARSALTQSLPENAPTGASAAGGTTGAGSGSGLEAGENRDERAGAGVSRALSAPLPIRRRELAARNDAAEKRADTGESGTFDNDLATHPGRSSRTALVAAAAAPPTAAKTLRLKPTEAAYVQAWTHAKPER